jgi:hypothetical protein
MNGPAVDYAGATVTTGMAKEHIRIFTSILKHEAGLTWGRERPRQGSCTNEARLPEEPPMCLFLYTADIDLSDSPEPIWVSVALVRQRGTSGAR